MVKRTHRPPRFSRTTDLHGARTLGEQLPHCGVLRLSRLQSRGEPDTEYGCDTEAVGGRDVQENQFFIWKDNT